MRRTRAASVSSLALITWMTSSISRMAMSSPSTRCRRSVRRARRKRVRRVTTSMRWSMYTCSRSLRPRVLGSPATRATLLKLNDSSSGVWRNSCSSTASGLKPVLMPMTSRRPWVRSVRSVTSEILSELLVRHAVFDLRDDLLGSHEIGQLGHDEAHLAGRQVLDTDPRASLEASPAARIGVPDLKQADDRSASGRSGPGMNDMRSSIEASGLSIR